MHWQAAEAISAELNGPVDSVEALCRLDLHGLHVDEAIEVLERRLLKLEAARGAHKGMPRKLTVIVGRGKHSSGAEASLPRAVEAYLAERGNNYGQAGLGCFEIRIKHGSRGVASTVSSAG
eukprot:scaffold655213_cov42-Prasinocladus_malaysianus.AAC.1